MRFVLVAVLLAGCAEPSDPVGGPEVTSGTVRHVKRLSPGPLMTLEAHCFERAPIDIDPLTPGEQHDCASWIEHEFEDGRTEEEFGPCTGTSTTERCYEIGLHPNICMFGSGHEIDFQNPFTDVAALASRAIVECVVR